MFPKYLRIASRVSLFVLTGVLSLAHLTAQLSVDPSSREESRIFYNAIWPASENIASGWNGNVGTGNAGSTATLFKDAVYLRVDYFRAMAGVPAGIVNNANFSSDAQKAALMMSSNNQLSHTPPSSWINYSAAGANAAANSNLFLGAMGALSVSGYMEDGGSNNTSAGHRRWILYPQSTQMGTGDIPATGSFMAANALWVIDNSTISQARPAVRDTFVTWPPKGYVPYTLIYPRWSFSYPGADFSGANVSMTRNGSTLAVQKEAISTGIGENTLVFIPENLDPNNWAGPVRPATDTTTNVIINNVFFGGSAHSFSYNVTAFDPTKDGVGTVQPVISGTANTQTGGAYPYQVNALTLASGYQWKVSSLATYSTVDGAEMDGLVTPSGYATRDSAVAAFGSFSYHLAQPNFQSSSIDINANVVPGAGGFLAFKSRLGYATNEQTAKIDVSTDGGNLWETIYSQAGNGGAGEGSFVDRSVSLAAYAGKEIRVRFLYDFIAGSAYTQTSSGFGWYLDAIAFGDTQTISGSVVGTVSASRDFSFTPPADGTYALQVRPQVYAQYLLGWSLINTVTATADGSPPPPPLPPTPLSVTRVVQLSGTLSFGRKNLGSNSYKTLVIANTGNSPLTITSMKYPAGFGGRWAGTIQPGATKSVRVLFHPTSKRFYAGWVVITSDATDGTTNRRITGTGK